jgi:hypothetical protein
MTLILLPTFLVDTLLVTMQLSIRKPTAQERELTR